MELFFLPGMDLETEIRREHSKRQAVRIASWIGEDGKPFGRLMELFLRGEYRVTQQSAWIVNICAERQAYTCDHVYNDRFHETPPPLGAE